MTGTAKSLQRPDRGKEKQATHRAGGERQGQDLQSPREREGSGREGKGKKMGVTADKGEQDRGLEAERAGR